MNTDKKSALVRAESAALALSGSQALARRGLDDLNQGSCPDEKTRLFCLDHRCTHDRCPGVPHLDFTLIPVENVRPDVLESSILEQEEGEYYVLHNRVVANGEIEWEPESLRDGRVVLRVPGPLRGQLRGPFFSKREALNFVEETRWERSELKLPRLIPHMWTGPDDVAHGSKRSCSFCAESDLAEYGKACPKRSWKTWYEVLGIPENAAPTQITAAYKKLVAEYDPQRLKYLDDIIFDGGYTQTQLRWFNAAYAILNDPEKRKQYDTELLQR